MSSFLVLVSPQPHAIGVRSSLTLLRILRLIIRLSNRSACGGLESQRRRQQTNGQTSVRAKAREIDIAELKNPSLS